MKAEIHKALERRLLKRMAFKGELVLACCPSLLDKYQRMLLDTFAAADRPFNETDARRLKYVLENAPSKGWSRSPYTRLLVEYEMDPPPSIGLRWDISLQPVSIADEYAQMAAVREPPLFGKHPDARVMDIA